MSEQTNYPKRGQMSEDGKVYTHTDGKVYQRMPKGEDGRCGECVWLLKVEKHIGCKNPLPIGCAWRIVEGAYAPSDCEFEACDMARAMIEQCVFSGGDCSDCGAFTDQNCPARVYLAAHGDAQAWEVVG